MYSQIKYFSIDCPILLWCDETVVHMFMILVLLIIHGHILYSMSHPITQHYRPASQGWLISPVTQQHRTCNWNLWRTQDMSLLIRRGGLGMWGCECIKDLCPPPPLPPPPPPTTPTAVRALVTPWPQQLSSSSSSSSSYITRTIFC